MITTDYNKLVRDLIVPSLGRRGVFSESRQLSENEFRKALDNKLDEEVAEFHEAVTLELPKEKQIEEIVDIISVLLTRAQTLGCNKDELEIKIIAKEMDKGGFETRTFLISTTEQG